MSTNAVNPDPKEPGEIGWPAGWAAPGEPTPPVGAPGRGPYHPDEDNPAIHEAPVVETESETPIPEQPQEDVPPVDE